jgi:hypothetical protein
VLDQDDPNSSGGTTHVDELPMRGAVDVVYVRSPIAHARLTAVDLAKATAASRRAGRSMGRPLRGGDHEARARGGSPLASRRYPPFVRDRRGQAIAEATGGTDR